MTLRGADEALEAYLPAAAFDGARPGYSFRSGDKGTGYYLEDAAAAHSSSRKRARLEVEEESGPPLPSLERLDAARAVYNQPLCRQSEVSGIDWKAAAKHGEDVSRKTEEFCKCFGKSIRAIDVVSGKAILADLPQFEARYRTVFRESGAKLQLQVHHRSVFLPAAAAAAARAPAAAFVLDLERHESLTTPVGAKFDGSLGLRGPRTQSMWVLYELAAAERAAPARVASMALCGWQPAEGETGAQALERLKRGKEWPAFVGLVETALGRGGWALRSAPLLSTAVGRCELQGRRPTMEDQLAVQLVPAPRLAWPAATSLLFLGLYDGHGGGACAAAVARADAPAALHAHLAAAAPLARGDVGTALTEAFAETDRAWLRDGAGNSGSCALTAVVGAGRIVTAHVGDSRAVLGTGAAGAPRAVRLTEDHKPDRPDEHARIVGAGGAVVLGGRCWRITHSGTSLMLATSRSLGDRHFKESWHAAAAAAAVAAADAAREAAEGVEAEAAAEAAAAAAVDNAKAAPDLLSAVPELSERPLAEDDRFLVLACDGVWDVLSDEQACELVATALAQPEATADAAAKALCNAAFEKGSEDNISAAVVVLRPYLA